MANLSKLLFVFLLATVLFSCAPSDDDDDDSSIVDDNDSTDDDDDSVNDDDDNDDDAPQTMPWLFSTEGKDAAIFDQQGRQVLLRGVNFNHLGDYFQSDPALPTVAELSDEDWDDAAALGMNIVRLVTTWSAWEPQRDIIDMDYLERVKEAVKAASARGIYVIIDMHQDAWSKFVYTPAEKDCPEGTHHQIGWDGAPEWATFTDDEPTCTPGSREDSPAVIRAWDNFYANRDGVRDELAQLWGFIATQFAHSPGVAGFDLINEPGNGSSLGATLTGLTQFYQSAIDEIRLAEEDAKAPGHLIFFETSVYGVPPAFNLGGPNIIFAPHNYFESIVQGFDGLLDLSMALYATLGDIYGTPVWIGEFGSFSDQETNENWMARFAELEDRFLMAGGTWWQWEQECGDPHDVRGAYPPSPDWIAEQAKTCGDSRMTPTVCSSRAYPRALPGRLLRMEASPCDGHLTFSGITTKAGIAQVWIPGEMQEEPQISGTGIGDVTATMVPGGWLFDIELDGQYEVSFPCVSL